MAGKNVISDKTEFICFNQDCTISSWNMKPLKLLHQFISQLLKAMSKYSKVKHGPQLIGNRSYGNLISLIKWKEIFQTGFWIWQVTLRTQVENMNSTFLAYLCILASRDKLIKFQTIFLNSRTFWLHGWNYSIEAIFSNWRLSHQLSLILISAFDF